MGVNCNMSVKGLVPQAAGLSLLLWPSAVMLDRDIIFDTDSLEFSGLRKAQNRKEKKKFILNIYDP